MKKKIEEKRRDEKRTKLKKKEEGKEKEMVRKGRLKEKTWTTFEKRNEPERTKRKD